MNSTGQTTRWLLLRGLGRDSRHWGQALEVLNNEFPYHEFIPVDLPGTGKEADRLAPLSMAANVDFLRDKYNEVLAAGPVNLLAISLGGMVAVDWMSRFPKEISRAVLINTSSRLNPFYQRFNISAAWALLRALITAKCQGHALALERCVAGWVVNDGIVQQDIAPLWASFHSPGKLGVSTLWRQLVAASQFSPPNLAQRLLLISSREDRLVNAECSVRLAEYWQQPLVVHPTAGHDLPVEDPQWLAKTLGEWLLVNA